MPDTWVTDLEHFLSANGSIAPTSGAARKLAEHITAIVVELTAEIEGIEKVACRCRPKAHNILLLKYIITCQPILA